MQDDLLEIIRAKFRGLRKSPDARFKVLVIRGLLPELRAAYEAGLLWKQMWAALQDAGYSGSYKQFCKTAPRLVGIQTQSVPVLKNTVRKAQRKSPAKYVAPKRAQVAPIAPDLTVQAQATEQNEILAQQERLQEARRRSEAWRERPESVTRKFDYTP